MVMSKGKTAKTRQNDSLDELKQKVKHLEQDKSKLQNELLGTASFLSNILETSSTITIVATDLDRNIVYWNSGAENLLGYTAEEMVGKKKVDILYESDDVLTRRAIDETRKHIMTHGEACSCDVVERTKDGRPIWIKLTMTPRFNGNGKVIGILGIGQDITGHKQTEKKLNYSLRKLRRAVGGTIHAMALTVEKRDPYTAGHQQRTTDLARAIAAEMNLPKDTIDAIRMAGVIHDLGKVYVPAEILNKPGALSHHEFSLIRCHPEAGYDVIKYIDFPWPIGQIVLQHHERLDGSGYPHGLKGDEICMEAKIISVADVVESMSSHRPYRPACGLEKAVTEIEKNRGILYDPTVVDACIKLISKNEFQFKVNEAAARTW
ncbi:MAG: PAS domain S-box protein [Chitinivibrionales bacterium]|nr:PAS domain S-box protein [Chitinivibrionales bacterium]